MFARLLLCAFMAKLYINVLAETNPDLYTIVQKAFMFAWQEYDKQRVLDKRYLALGIDDREGKTRSGAASSSFQLSGMFRFMENETLAQSNQCTVGILATQRLSKMLKLPFNQLQADPAISSTFQKFYSQICQVRRPKCNPKMIYRTIDGSCNNIQHPTWGMAFRPEKRYLPAIYSDGISKPRKASVLGKLLPSPRLISNVLFDPPVRDLQDETNSVVVMQFGQLIAHDMIDTPMLKGARKADIECCKLKPQDRRRRSACFPLTIPKGDRRFHSPCMNFVRSVAGTTDDCSLGVRDQINQLTSYLDADYLYGGNQKDVRLIRTLTGGELVMDNRGLFGEHDVKKNCMKKEPGDYCMKAGDRRIHIVPTLTSISVIFLREHNRIVRDLAQINPHWNDETLYQETRKIIMAINTQIIYTEYLPIILGDKTMAKYQLNIRKRGFNTIYDPTVDSTISNVFAVAAYRFGHTQVPGDVGLLNKYMELKTVPLEDTFNKPATALKMNGKGCDWLNRWLIHEKGAKVDRFFEPAVRDELLVDDDNRAFDLPALSTQRGREHGIPSYNHWRHWCGLSTAGHFHTGPGGFVDIDHKTVFKLSTVYRHSDDVDLFTGAMSEILLPGAKVGPTFACILAQQFRDLKFGDRFWYENNFPDIGFTEAQLNSIKNIRLSRVMCDVMEEQFIQADVFNIPSPSNPTVHCGSIPGLDLRLWEDMNKGHMLKPPTVYNSVHPKVLYWP